MDTKALRQKILDLAIRGKLVPQDPNDEPASALLERIRAEKERLIAEGKIKRPKKSKTADTPRYQQEAPFKIPDSWVWCKLDDVISLKSGDSLNTRDIEIEGECIYPIYGGNGISGYNSYFNVEHETIIIGRVGFYCGSVHKTHDNAWVTDNALIVTNYGLFPDYLYFLLQSLNLGKTANSTAQPVVSGKGILPLLVAIPPILEQKRIAAEICGLLALIETIENEKNEIEGLINQAKSKILSLAIQGKLVDQNPADEPAEALLKRINPSWEPCDTPHYENLPFDIPENWEWCRVNEVFEVNPKSHLSDDIECGFVPMALVDDGFAGGHSYERRKWGEIKKGYCHFIDGDLAVAKISPCFENRKSIILAGLPNGVGGGTTELVILRNSEVFMPFFLYLVKSDWYLHEGTKYFKGVVGQQRVNREIFSTLLIPIPPIDEQKRIVENVDSLFAWLDEIGSQLQ